MAEKSDLYPPGTSVAVSNRGPECQWQIGTYQGIDPGGLHIVRFSAEDEDRFFDANRIRGPGEIYIDSRGVAMEPMTFGEALETVHELASDHQPGCNDDPGNENLTMQLAWQLAALTTMEDLVVNYHERIDETFKPPVSCGCWPESTVGCLPDLNPMMPVDALRICLELGESGIPDHRSRDPEEADWIDRANQACDLVRDLLGLHGRDFASLITVVPILHN